MTDFQTIQKDSTHRMESAITVLVNNFRKLRTGRAHASLVEDIKVSYHSVPTPLKQIASITTPDAKTIIISPYDRSQLEQVSKAIQASELGLTPNSNDESVIINLPPLNEESRNNFRKQARAEAEQTKIAIRNVRRDAHHKIKEQEASEDLTRQHNQQIDKLTDDFINRVNDLLAQKEQDLMEF